MKSIWHHLGYLVIGASLAGCGPIIQFAPTNRPPRALSQRSPAEVEIFVSKRPARAYTEVGLLHAESRFGNSRAELINALRIRAAQHGCEAVIITGSGEKVTGGFVHGTGSTATVSTASVSQYSAVCVVYK